MQHKIKLKKVGFKTVFPKARQFYKALSENRDRLSPWFWWTEERVTPTYAKTLVFMTAYILDTKRKKLMHTLDKKKPYDEQFLILNNDNFAGMTGLDNIDNTKKDAEMWYFVTHENEGKGIASKAIKILEDYTFDNKSLYSIYVKTAKGNNRSEKIMERNQYRLSVIEWNVPTSRRNPKITDLKTWIKQK